MSEKVGKQAQAKKLSPQAKAAVKMALMKKMPLSKAMREVGFSESYSKNPQRITKNEGYRKILDKAGLTDDFLAARHREAVGSTLLREYDFPHTRKESLVKIDEDDPAWNENGRKKQYKTIHESIPVTKKAIKKIVEKIAGAKFVEAIVYYDKTTVFFTVPDNGSRNKALEMSYKVKGHFSPEEHEHVIADATEAEREALADILLNNK